MIYYLVERHIKDYRRYAMSRETLKTLIDMIDDNDIETIFQVLIRFVPEDEAAPDELAAIMEAKADDETVSHEAINWD